MRPVKGQVDDLLAEIKLRAERDERVCVTTLTKRWQRISQTTSGRWECESGTCTLRWKPSSGWKFSGPAPGVFDVLVGINLLRKV